MSWLIAAPIDTGDTWLEEIIAGLEVTAIGMGVVFSVLVLLFVLLSLMGRLLASQAVQAAKVAAPHSEQDAPSPSGGSPELTIGAPVHATEETTAVIDAGANAATGELTAAIVAALAAAMSAPDAGTSRPRAGGPDVSGPGARAPSRWATAGRIEQAAARESRQEMRGR